MNLLYLAGNFLGFIFLSTCLSKVVKFDDHAYIMKGYGMLPLQLVKPFLVFLTLLEGIAAVLLLGLVYLNIAAFIAAVLLLIYIIAISANLSRGNNDMACGCGGALGDQLISPWLILRNFVFIGILALIYFISHSGSVDFTDRLLILLTASIVTLTYSGLNIVAASQKRVQKIITK